MEFFKKYKIDYRLEESFRPEFEKNTSKYSDLIQIEDGNILEKKWDKGKFIEILGVDAAKGTRLVKYFMTELYPNLAAGKSTLLFQDYIFFRHPSLIVSIGMLEDHLERLCEGVYTVVYKVIKDITLNDVTSLLEKYKDRDSQLELMDQAVNLCVKRHHAAVVSLAHVTLIKQLESIEAAERKLNDVKRKYRSEFENNPFCKHQLFLSQELVANKILRLDEFLTPL